MNRTAKGVMVFLLVLRVCSELMAADFIHPGLLHSRADLQRMHDQVQAGHEPWASGFDVFKADTCSQLDYRMRGPGEEIGRNPNVNSSQFDQDANASYQLALMWAVTGDKAYSDKALQIVNAWSRTLKRVTGRDAVLMGGLGPFKMINAAEILRYTHTGWSDADIQQCERMFLEAIYPAVKDFALFANGNWDIAAVQTVMAIGVFCNDRAIFERGLHYYIDGGGDGCLTHYVINEAGQCQESGRDQQHTQLGLALLSACCEIAWHQGLDLYGYADDRLLKGFEYTARYNLGEDVPFEATLDRTGKYPHDRISDKGRGRLRAVYEMVYNHYVNRAGLAAPYTRRAAEKVRPEGPGRPGADHPGFGTLLFSRTPEQRDTVTAPTTPGGLLAQGRANQIDLSWVAVVNATRYTVKRRTNPREPWMPIAAGLTSPTVTDKNVTAGQVYSYRVCAGNVLGTGPDAQPVRACAGLPAGWNARDIGPVKVPGHTVTDGSQYTLAGSGTSLGQDANDQMQFAYRTLHGDGTLIARYVPQLSSQFTRFGLILRTDLAADAPGVSLAVGPGFRQRGQEFPAWQVELGTRRAGMKTEVASSLGLDHPYVIQNRLLGTCWLRVERRGDTVMGAVSSDGHAWTQVGQVSIPLGQNLLVGLGVCSGLENVATVVKFDHVTVDEATTEPRAVSPDGRVSVTFSLLEGGIPSYRVDYQDQPLMLNSRLGLEPNLLKDFAVQDLLQSGHRGQWTNPCGERSTVVNAYQELNVDLEQASGIRLRLTFRAYDEGVALRYALPEQKTQVFQFTGEHTEFRLPQNTHGYEEHGTEGEYHRVPIAQIQPWCERPLTLEYANGLYACLTEAAVTDYARMLLSPLPEVSGALVSALGGRTANTDRANQVHDPHVRLLAGQATPWRVLVVGSRPGDLLEHNDLLLNLNPPCALANTHWIKPGKAMRDTTLTTANSKAIIDFAAEGGLQYTHLDSGWYGTEDAEAGDATTVRVPNLDIPEIIRYGREKGVGLILYVDRRQIKRQRDILFPLYERWGVAGVKIGFVDVGPQAETAWITETIQKAAEHHLMLNIHDGYRATGNNRTWPNLMTVEGIRGNEHMPTAEHNCTLPFTRYINGIGDYTVCYYDHRIKTTHAHQLAMAVISFSPWQWIYWYDSPSMSHHEPELEWFRQVPTVWDDTRVINGVIGQYATIARRKGDDWFIGTINNSQPRTLQIPLTFLTPNRGYSAHLYVDDEGVQTQTHVGIKTLSVTHATTLDVPLKSAGGQAVWMTPSK